jgi:glycolate oxidase
MEMIKHKVEVVDGKAEIVLDGGVQRGSDVVKVVCMGATAVAIGKMQGWGLAAGGVPGMVRVLEILEEEIRIAMGLMGVTAMEQLNPNYVRPADLVTMPHEMSSWVNMPVGRIP